MSALARLMDQGPQGGNPAPPPRPAELELNIAPRFPAMEAASQSISHHGPH